MSTKEFREIENVSASREQIFIRHPLKPSACLVSRRPFDVINETTTERETQIQSRIICVDVRCETIWYHAAVTTFKRNTFVLPYSNISPV